MTISPSHQPNRHLRLLSRESPVAGNRRADEPPPARWVLWVIVVGAVVLSVAGWVLTQSAADTQDANTALQSDKVVLEEQRNAAAEQATTLADQVAAACAAGGKTAEELLRVGACQQAQQVKQEPVPGIPGPAGAQGPGPTPEQIRGAVAAYLLEHPPPAGRAPTEGEVAAAVAQYLTVNPPTPGRPPTGAEIADAVATYFATNPAPPGKDGEPGRPPTAEEIRVAVADYLAEHPPAAGPPGAAGPAGPTCPAGSSLQNVTYADSRAGLGCVLDAQPTGQPPTSPTPIPDGGGSGG